MFSDLSLSHGSASDDGVVGEALARAGVYTFRDPNHSVDEALKRERQKPESNQGFRTAARDLRRFYELLGFVSSGKVTLSADLVLAAGHDPGVPAVKSAWQRALLDLDLNGSHPYRILTRLASDLPGKDWKLLALCLEPRDDSVAEYERIVALASADDPDRARNATGTSEAQFRNALKILPSLGLQLGDIVQAPGRRIGQRTRPAPVPAMSPKPKAAAAPPVSTSAAAPKARPTHPVSGPPRLGGAPPGPAANRHRVVTSSTIAAASPEPGGGGESVTTDLTNGIESRGERLARHNRLVRAWARVSESGGFSLMENPFDCLAISPDKTGALLVEAKTLASPREPDDERRQVRDALGQLLYYEELELPGGTPPPVKIAIFDGKPSNNHIRLLNRWEIVVVWVQKDRFEGDSKAHLTGAVETLLTGRFNSVDLSSAPTSEGTGSAN